MPIKFKTVYVFKTPFYEPKYKEFYNVLELKNFLQTFDFMKPHAETGLQTGLPEFQLGTYVKGRINGVMLDSKIKWGPRFLVGRSVKLNDDNKVFAEIPVDSIVAKGNFVEREYKMVPLKNGMVDAVINLQNLKQIWPKRRKYNSVLQKFIIKNSKDKHH